MKTFRYKVADIRPDLEAHVEKSLESVPHVQSVHIEADSSSVIIEHDGADADEVLAALHEEGIRIQAE
jgi:copper chaperone CopZ